MAYLVDYLLHHGLALVVVIPFLASAFAFILKNQSVKIFYISTAISAFIVLILFVYTMVISGMHGANVPYLTYDFGGWAPPIGISFRLDNLSALMLLLVYLIVILLHPWLQANVLNEIKAEKIYLFYSLMLLCIAGSAGVAITEDAFNLFVFLEITSISSYGLIALADNRRAYFASFNYLIMGTIGATFYVIAVGLLFQVSGSLNISDMLSRAAEYEHKKTIVLAVALLYTGLMLKAALFPLSAWIRRAYGYGPCSAVAFLSATTTKLSFYIILRFTYFGFNHMEIEALDIILKFIEVTAMIAMIWGAYMASKQINFQHILAYSSISQVGYMFLAFSLLSDEGLRAAVIILFAHAIAKCSLFMIAGLWKRAGIAPWLVQLQGRGVKLMLIFICFIIFTFSLIGVPMSAGFVSKFMLVSALLAKQHWAGIFAVVVSSVLAVKYVWRIIEIAALQKVSRNAPEIIKPNKVASLGLLIPAAIILFIGIQPTPLRNIAQAIVEDSKVIPQAIQIDMHPIKEHKEDNHSEESGY